MDLNLANKTAIVTGASRGIGLVTVQHLIDGDARVAGLSRTITPELKESGAIPIQVDLSDPADAAEAVQHAVDLLGGVDMLVNNVGAVNEPVGFLETPDDVWTATFNTNFFSAVAVTRAALPRLIERRGSIVNVSSVSARIPYCTPGPYGASKAALTALTKVLSEEFGPFGVRVNTVSPGPVHTDIWDAPGGFGAQVAAKFETEHKQFVDELPGKFGVTLGRLAEADEVATLVTFLLSDRAANITGADFVTDGGMIKSV